MMMMMMMIMIHTYHYILWNTYILFKLFQISEKEKEFLLEKGCEIFKYIIDSWVSVQ